MTPQAMQLDFLHTRIARSIVMAFLGYVRGAADPGFFTSSARGSPELARGRFRSPWRSCAPTSLKSSWFWGAGALQHLIRGAAGHQHLSAGTASEVLKACSTSATGVLQACSTPAGVLQACSTSADFVPEFNFGHRLRQ